MNKWNDISSEEKSYAALNLTQHLILAENREKAERTLTSLEFIIHRLSIAAIDSVRPGTAPEQSPHIVRVDRTNGGNIA